MNWTNEILESVESIVIKEGYPYAAGILTQRLGKFIHPEQLRGARRRWLARREKEDNLPLEDILHDTFRNVVTYSNGYEEEPVTGIQEFVFDEEVNSGKEDPPPRYVHEPVVQKKQTPILDSVPYNGTVCIGAMGDTHLGSKYERIDLIQQLYEYYASQGVTKVFHTGNYIEGDAKFNQESTHTHGIDNQLLYFVQHYPRIPGITTYYISGDDHEGWYHQKGINAGERLEDIAHRKGRNDLVYLGYMEADIPLYPNSEKLIRVIHPGGGSAQAVSYTSQKIMQAVEHDDIIPLIFFVGHYHKSEFLPNYRGSYIFQTGTFQEQSPFMRKKMLRADIGAWIVRLTFIRGSLVSVGGDFISFKQSQWSYK